MAYNNEMCLNCHNDVKRFHTLSDSTKKQLVQIHEWLPNQAAHFRSVRCIECHTQINDSVLVAHLIRPKEMAVKGCNECHSKNSLLMSSLYKFQSREQRKDGFFNGIIMNQSYVIGANRNEYLNWLSFVIFFITVAVIAVHITFRTIKKRSRK